jgi:hypothetical protein
VTGYELDGLFSILGIASFFLHHSVQADFEIHPNSYPKGTEGDFPGGKEAWA